MSQLYSARKMTPRTPFNVSGRNTSCQTGTESSKNHALESYGGGALPHDHEPKCGKGLLGMS